MLTESLNDTGKTSQGASDVRTWPQPDTERVDLVCGGFPCQDISGAGCKAGIEGERSGLWREMHRIICELRPRFVVVENVAEITVRGMGTVLGDLAASGFDAEWRVLSAEDFGAPHKRERAFFVAYPRESIGDRSVLFDGEDDFPVDEQWRASQGIQSGREWQRWLNAASFAVDGPVTKDDFCRVDDGISEGMGALGNAVVPQIAEWIGRRVTSVL